MAEHIDPVLSRIIDRAKKGSSTTSRSRRPKLKLRSEPLPQRERWGQYQPDPDWSRVNPNLVRTFHCLCTGELAWPLFLVGSTGVGKTMAALALLSHVDHGLYLTVRALSRLVIEAQQDRLCLRDLGFEDPYLGSRPVRANQIWEVVRGMKLAVLDDVGMRPSVSDHVYDCVVEFLEARQSLPTILISNHEPRELARLYDDPLVSRMLAGSRFRLTGPDLRLQWST